MRAVVIDDEQDAIDLLASLLKEVHGIKLVASYLDPEKAIAGIETYQPDIIFIDIQMPQLNGFEVLDQLDLTSYQPKIVFTTAHSEYAIKAIKYVAFDYLLKPISSKVLIDSIDRLRSRSVNDLAPQVRKLIEYLKPDNKLRINTRTGYILINVNDIVYCKADGNYTEVFLGNNDKEIAVMNLGKIQKLLINFDFFLRLDRSVMINRSYLFKVDRSNRKIYLKKNQEVLEVIVAMKTFSQL